MEYPVDFQGEFGDAPVADDGVAAEQPGAGGSGAQGQQPRRRLEDEAHPRRHQGNGGKQQG